MGESFLKRGCGEEEIRITGSRRVRSSPIFPWLPQGRREGLWKLCGLCGSRGEAVAVEWLAASGSSTAGEGME
jgi:hypothetical protein